MWDDLWYEDMVASGWLRYEVVEFTLRTGREFRYQMRDYPFRAESSERDLEALCHQILADKYRYCVWDREHPRTDAETEIFGVLKVWMLQEAAKVRALRAEALGAHDPDEEAPSSTWVSCRIMFA